MKKLFLFLCTIIALHSEAQVGYGRTVINAKQDGALVGVANLAGNGTTNDATALNNMINACSGDSAKIILLPPGNYLINSNVQPANDWIYLKAAVPNTVNFISNSSFSGNDMFQFIAHSHIKIEGINFTNNHSSNYNSFLRFTSSPRKNEDIWINGCWFTEYSTLRAIDWGTAANLDSTHWYDDVHIVYCKIRKGYKTGFQTLTTKPVSNNDVQGINLQQTCLGIEIGWNIIEDLSGDGIKSDGSNEGLQRNPKQGSYDIHNNTIQRCLMLYEVAPGRLNHNIRFYENTLNYPSLNGGFAISGNSDGGEWHHNTIRVANRSAWEGVYRNTAIHDNIIYIDAWRDTSQGIKNSAVSNATASAWQLYGSGNSIYNNRVYKTRTGADALTPSYFNDITLIGKASGGDTAFVNASYLGYTDYPAFLQVYHNTLVGTGLSGSFNRVLDPGDTSFLPFRNIFFSDNTIISDMTSTPLLMKAFNPNIGKNYWYMSNPPASGAGIVDIEAKFLSKGRKMQGFMEKQIIFGPADWYNKNTAQYTPYPGTGNQRIVPQLSSN